MLHLSLNNDVRVLYHEPSRTIFAHPKLDHKNKSRWRYLGDLIRGVHRLNDVDHKITLSDVKLLNLNYGYADDDILLGSFIPKNTIYDSKNNLVETRYIIYDKPTTKMSFSDNCYINEFVFQCENQIYRFSPNRNKGNKCTLKQKS